MMPGQFNRTWRGPGMGEIAPAPAPVAAPATQTEEEHWIVIQRTLAANAAANELGMDVAKDGDFLLTHIWGSSTGAYTILMRLFTGRPLSTAAVRNTNMVGTAAFKQSIKPILYPAGSRISLDLLDVSGAQNVIELVLGGVKVLRAR